jgi:ribosomal protein S6--L-glutamate ligase
MSLRLVSFDALRTLDIPRARYLKPEEWFRHKELVQSADWVLFPEYWQVNPLVYAWKKRIFPSIGSYHIGHDKVEMTRAFEAVCPGHLPTTRILPATDSGIAQVLDEFTFPLVAKEIRNAMGRGVHLIEDRRGLHCYAEQNPVMYIQEYLPISRDLRVVHVGGRTVCAYWREAAPGRFHTNVAQGGRVCFDGVPHAPVTLVENIAAQLGIDHAGFDLAAVDDRWYLLEFNVRFGTQALNSRGVRLGPIIMEYLQRLSFPPRDGVPGVAGPGRRVSG